MTLKKCRLKPCWRDNIKQLFCVDITSNIATNMFENLKCGAVLTVGCVVILCGTHFETCRIKEPIYKNILFSSCSPIRATTMSPTVQNSSLSMCETLKRTAKRKYPSSIIPGILANLRDALTGFYQQKNSIFHHIHMPRYYFFWRGMLIFTGWWFQPIWKKSQNGFIFPNFRSENSPKNWVATTQLWTGSRFPSTVSPSMNWVEEDGIMRLPKTPNNWRRWFAAHFGKFPYHESIVYDKIPNSPIIGKNGVYPIDIHFIYGVYYTVDSWGYHFEGFSQHFSPTPPLGDTIKASCSDFPLFSQLSSFTWNLSTPDNPVAEPSRAGS